MTPRRRKILRYVLIILAAYAGLCLVLYLFQRRLIYLPSRGEGGSPHDLGLTHESVTIESGDDERIHAWWVPHPTARGTALFCHGNAGNLTHRLQTVEIAHRLRLNILLFDYRGYGKSEGTPSEQALRADVHAAWNYLVETRAARPKSITLWGRSLGGAVAASLTEDVTPAGIIVESSFTSLPDMAQRRFPWLPARYLCRDELDAARRLASCSVPKLILHSPDDDIVPFSMGEELMRVAAEPKRFVRLRGDHNNGFIESGDIYIDALDRFLTEVFAP